MLLDSGQTFNVCVRRPSREAAQELHDRGIVAIPLVGKGPPKGFPLGRYFREHPTETDLDQWFPAGNENVGAVLGDVSGGVAVRDFDDNASFTAWASNHAGLSATLPIARTGREGGGYHVWFYPDPGDVRTLAGGSAWLKLGDGELRFENCYVVVPHSIHPATGTTYSWERSLDHLAYVPDLHQAGLTQSGTHEIKKGAGGAGWTPGDNPGLPTSVKEAIRLTLPSEYGTRHAQIFELARALRGMQEFRCCDPNELRAVFHEWWQAARPTIRTQSWAESWRDFLDGWRRVRTPWGSAAVCQAFAESQGRGIDRLIDACRRIHASQNGQPFFLSGRTAARMLGRPHRTVARWLNKLVSQGMLVVVEAGTYASMEGSVYHYEGPGKNTD